MNKNQMIVLWLGVFAIVVFLAYPPWIVRFSSPELTVSTNVGYAPLWKPPLHASVDVARLFIQMLIAGVVGVAVILSLKSKPSPTGSEPDSRKAKD